MSVTGSLENRLQIRELIEVYAHGVNQRDEQIWASTWHTEATWVLAEISRASGKDNIVNQWHTAMAGFKYAFMSSSVAEIKVSDCGTLATSCSYTSEHLIDVEDNEIQLQGVYNDQLLKVDERWLFSERVFKILHPKAES